MFDKRTRKAVAVLAIAGQLVAFVGIAFNQASLAVAASVLLIPATILAIGHAWPSVVKRDIN